MSIFDLFNHNDDKPFAPMIAAQTALIALAKAPEGLSSSDYSVFLDSVGTFLSESGYDVTTLNFSDNCLQFALQHKDEVCSHCGQRDCVQNQCWVTYCLYQLVRGHVPSRYDYERHTLTLTPQTPVLVVPTDASMCVLNIDGAAENFNISPAGMEAISALPFVVKVAQFKDQAFVEVTEPLKAAQYDKFMEAVRK